MNTEQQEYISLIKRSTQDDILIKRTGWEEINLLEHAHKNSRLSTLYLARCMWKLKAPTISFPKNTLHGFQKTPAISYPATADKFHSSSST